MEEQAAATAEAEAADMLEEAAVGHWKGWIKGRKKKVLLLREFCGCKRLAKGWMSLRGAEAGVGKLRPRVW